MTTADPAATPGPPVPPFTAAERRALLDEVFRGREELGAIELSGTDSAGDGLSRTRELMGRLVELHDRYRDGVPRVPLSRCPFSRDVFVHSFDPYDLDGLWWDYEAPIRPPDRGLATSFVLTGAVRLGTPVASAPFLCKPGPQAPFVIPRLLEHPDITAVVSAIAVGPHEAYPVVYFAQPVPLDVPRVNDWAAPSYHYYDHDGRYVWGDDPERPWEYDFDLAPWVEAGKLRWIEPGDDAFVLREGSRDCPYLRADGSHDVSRIQKGKVWS